MSLPDSFYTLTTTSTGEYKDKGSKFIAYAFAVTDETDFKIKLKEIKKEHFSAAHVCWAFVAGPNKEIEKSSDDREPSGSAGRPILAAILGKDLRYVGIAVVRYFGGKLLGVPGLINAYGNAAKEAITHANFVQKRVFYRVFVGSEFSQQHEIIKLCKQSNVKFFPDMQNQFQGITFEVSPSLKDPLLASLDVKNFKQIIELGITYE